MHKTRPSAAKYDDSSTIYTMVIHNLDLTDKIFMSNATYESPRFHEMCRKVMTCKAAKHTPVILRLDRAILSSRDCKWIKVGLTKNRSQRQCGRRSSSFSSSSSAKMVLGLAAFFPWKWAENGSGIRHGCSQRADCRLHQLSEAETHIDDFSLLQLPTF